MDVKAVCSKQFYPAVHTSGTRKITDIYWIVIHDEEAPTAESAASWFRNSQSGGSAHLCVDDNECFRCLDNTAIAWGAASCFGANSNGFHIEQAGYAKWAAVNWWRHRNTIERAAYKTALHCHLFNIPVQFVFAKDLPNKRGITTHAEVSKASQRLDPANKWAYTHSDPGLFWPRRLFMNRVRKYYAELTV